MGICDSSKKGKDFYEQKDLENHSKSMSLDAMKIIEKQMENCVCKIESNKGGCGSGFFCNIPYDDWNLLRVLVTNNHVLDEDDIKTGNKISFSINNSKIIKEILIDESRIKFTSEDYDVTFIEIKEEDGIKRDSFLDIDAEIDEVNPDETYRQKPVYLLHYPKGIESQKSEGLIKNITIINNNYIDIQHFCDSTKGSSGGPIINCKTNKVIGIHKGGEGKEKNWNLGTFIRGPLEYFKKEINLKLNNPKFKKNISEMKDNINMMNNSIYTMNIIPNNNEMINNEKIMAITFMSTDWKVHYSIPCKSNDKFFKIVNLLYEQYPKYKETRNYFLYNGKIIKEYKTLKENNIKSGDIIILNTFDDY